MVASAAYLFGLLCYSFPGVPFHFRKLYLLATEALGGGLSNVLVYQG
jgi:hypothetical protein